MAQYICILTAFSLVPQNFLIFKVGHFEIFSLQIWQIRQLQLVDFTFGGNFGSYDCRINITRSNTLVFVNSCKFGSCNCRIILLKQMPSFEKGTHILYVSSRKSTQARQFLTQLTTDSFYCTLPQFFFRVLADTYLPMSYIIRQ